MKTHIFALLILLLILPLAVIVQAQPEFSRDELRLIKNHGNFSNAVKYRLPQEKFPMPEITDQSRSALADGNLDSTFGASVTEGFGYVNKTVVQPDGKIIAVGLFQRANGARTNGIARFNANGSLDTTFNSGGGANAAILAAALQPDGKLIIGGAFTSFNNQTVNRIVRLNSDGSLDSSFSTAVAFNGQINDLLILPDGKIIVGGAFSLSSSRLVRLNSNGTLDSLSVSVNGTVYTIAVGANGKIVIGGIFSQPRASVARLNNDGSLDSAFSPTTGTEGGAVYKTVVQPDGKVIAGGYFPAFNGTATDSLVRLNDNGAVDTTFEITNNPQIQNLSVNGLAIQPDGKILAGFFDDSYLSFADVRRFNADGSTDTTFNTNTNNSLTVTDVNLLADGKTLAAGYFVSVNNQPRLRLVKLNANGTLDNTFNPLVSSFGIVDVIKRQPDGKIIIGGDFEYVNGVARRAIARLNADGTLDNTFNIGTGFFGDIYAVEIQPDGKIIIGGSFGGDSTFPASSIARISSNGGFDTVLNNGFILVAYALAIQPDGKILVGGQILNQSGNLLVASRLTPNGSMDSSFNPPVLPNGSVRALLVQPSGKIIVGGTFFNQGTFQRSGIARLNENGSLDTAFTSGGPIYSLKSQSDGTIYAGGSGLFKYLPEGTFDSTFNVGSGFNNTIRAVEVQSDGKVLVGGFFTTYNGNPVNRIIRLSNTGTLDSTFNPQPSGTIFALNSQPDGKILVGGQFLDFNGTEKLSLVRLQGTANVARTIFDFDGDGKADVSVFRSSNGAWYLQQSSAGFTGVTFGFGTDKLVPADYDGDGKTDVAVYRGGTWYLQQSTAGFTGVTFGDANDIPVPADYDGDGKADIAVFRPSNGTWYLQRSQLGFTGIAFGQNGDKPVAADYDGDGKADIAVNRAGTWYIQRSQLGFYGIQFGDSNDKLVPADYDGDGKADIAVFRPSNGTWYLQQSTAGFTGIAFGLGTDIPTAADYDGDGKADVAVFRNGTWYLQRSTQGFTGVAFGASTDMPIPNVYVR